MRGNIFSFLISFFSFFWFLHYLRKTFFWLSLWQIKEYRLDRFLSELKERKKIIYPKNFLLALLFLFFSPFLIKINFLNFDLLQIFGFLFFTFWGIWALYLLLKKRWLFPSFTLKLTVLFLFSIFLEVIFLIKILSTFYLSSLSIIYFFLFEVSFIPAISFIVFLFQIPTFFLKRFIIYLAKRKIKKAKNLITVGITGSYGKTSVKEFLAFLLSLKYKVLKTEKNYNSEIGVAKTILSFKEKDLLSKEKKIFVCEMGAYRKGEIKAICEIVSPKIGILTGISSQHVALFGSLKDIKNTKYELIASLPEDGIAIFNGGNKICLGLAQRTSIKKYIYSLSEGDFDIFAKEVKVEKDFIEFIAVSKKFGQRKIHLNLLGKHQIENFLGACLCSLILGVPFEKIEKAAPKIKTPETSLSKKRGKGGVTVIDDSYSQNPDGVMSALDYLSLYPGKKIIIMPCLIELGDSAPSIHKSIGRKIGEICDLCIILTPTFFEEIKLGAKEKGMKEERIVFSQDEKKIASLLKEYLKKENVILIEGRVPEKIKKIVL